MSLLDRLMRLLPGGGMDRVTFWCMRCERRYEGWFPASPGCLPTERFTCRQCLQDILTESRQTDRVGSERK